MFSFVNDKDLDRGIVPCWWAESRHECFHGQAADSLEDATSMKAASVLRPTLGTSVWDRLDAIHHLALTYGQLQTAKPKSTGPNRNTLIERGTNCHNHSIAH